MHKATFRGSFAALVLAAAFVPGAAAAEAVGRVVSLSGSAWAEGRDAERRPLGCGDVVHAGDRVVVDGAGRLGVLAEDVYAQLQPGTAMRFGRTGEGAPDVTLDAGRVRLVDTRAGDGAARFRLATPQADARGVGSDTEAYVFQEKVGTYAMVCEWAEPIEVARPADGERVLAEPGECVVAKDREPIYKARAQEQRIPLAGADACQPGPILGPVAQRFSPTDVAAAPLPSGLLAPAPPAFLIEPCEATGCLSTRLGVRESPAPPGGGQGLGVIEAPAPPRGGLGVIESPAPPASPALP